MGYETLCASILCSLVACQCSSSPLTQRVSIPSKLRRAGIEINTKKPVQPEELITEADKAVAMKIVHKNTGPVFSDQTGLMKISPVKLEYEEGFVPTQSHRQIIPYAYQPKLSAHLRNLRRDKVITDVDPSEPIDCILNVTICEKKMEGEIRMNINMRPMNKGSKHTKYHILLPQEI